VLQNNRRMLEPETKSDPSGEHSRHLFNDFFDLKLSLRQHNIPVFLRHKVAVLVLSTILQAHVNPLIQSVVFTFSWLRQHTLQLTLLLQIQ